jgi:hypothetical protein
MTPSTTTTLHLPQPRGHALRDVGFLATLVLVIAAFVVQAIRI